LELKTVKKLVIITEAVLEEDILRIINEHNAKGYTTYRNLTGVGTRSNRSGYGDMRNFRENIRIETIISSEEKAKAIMGKIINEYLASKYAGIAYLEDVQVERIYKF